MKPEDMFWVFESIEGLKGRVKELDARLDLLEGELTRLKRRSSSYGIVVHADTTAIPSFAKEQMAEIEDGDGS